MENTKEIDIAQAIEEVVSIMKDVITNKTEKDWLNSLQSTDITLPNHRPGKLNTDIPTHDTETRWQRELYRDEDIWMDAELPIGYYTKQNVHSRRIDLAGKYKERYVLCELKYTKQSGTPLTAVLQLLAYLKLLKTHCNNSDSLKTLTKIHHSNARKKNFDWEAFAANPILLLRANDNYWSSFSRSTKRHIVGRIIDVCKKYGIQINLYKNETELIMKKENGQYTVAESYK